MHTKTTCPWEQIADKLALVLMNNGVGGRQFNNVLHQYQQLKENTNAE